MGVTRFPQGLEVGDSTTAATFSMGGVSINPLHYATAGYEVVAGTVIVGATGSTAFIPSGLTTASFAVACPYGPLVVPGTAGGFSDVSVSLAGGTVTISGWDYSGTASSTAGTASYFAIGPV